MADDETAERPDLPYACCEHCGCGEPGGYWQVREGHDDTCASGCNDDKVELRE